MKKLIIFDLDGTLVDSEVIACEVLLKYWAEHGVHLTEDEFKINLIGAGSNSVYGQNILSKMPSYVDEEGDKLLDKALSERVKPVSGIIELLKNIDQYDLCVASNSSLSYVKNTLSSAGLDNYFNNQVFSAEQVLRPKPNPDLFLYVIEKLGYKASECIVIEDSLSGVRAARKSKVKVIGFTAAKHFNEVLKNRLYKEKADFYCSSSEELLKVISANLLLD